MARTRDRPKNRETNVNDTKSTTRDIAVRQVGLVLDAAAIVGVEVHDISISRLTLGRRPEVAVYGNHVDEATARALVDAIGGTGVVMGAPYGHGPQANLNARCDDFDVMVLVDVLPPAAKLAAIPEAELVAELQRRKAAPPTMAEMLDAEDALRKQADDPEPCVYPNNPEHDHPICQDGDEWQAWNARRTAAGR
jgi:hypothetical protein